MNSGHVLRVLSLKFPKDGSAQVPGSWAEICAPWVAVLLSSHASQPVVCQSQLFLAHQEFCLPGISPFVHESGHGGSIHTVEIGKWCSYRPELAFLPGEQGVGQGAAYVISMPLLCAHVSPFPEEVKGLQTCLLYFCFSLWHFFLISAHSVWFFSNLAVSFSLMISCPLQDLSILRFISLNEVSLADLLGLLSI